MNTNLHIDIRQNQQLALTPQMQQSIKLLQLSTVELNAYVQQMILENPFLEQESTEEGFPIDSSAVQEAPIDPNDRFQTYWDEFAISKRKPVDSALSLEERFTTPHTLIHHLREQLRHHTTDPKIRWIGDYIIDCVDDDGYMRKPLDEIVSETRKPHDLITQVLTLLQSFDPVGVCSPDLSTCLRIQLKDQGLLTADIQRILDHLPQLIDLGPKEVAKRCQVPDDFLRETLALFKTLNPRPGLMFDTKEAPLYVIPDVFLVKDKAGTWLCELNDKAFPNVTIDRQSYLAVCSTREGAQQPLKVEDRQYVNTHISGANWLLRSLRQRALTVLGVAQSIVNHQQAFLNRGKVALRPLILKEVALELGIHESTVSRAVTNKYVATPFGIMELKEFFNIAVHQAYADITNKGIQLEIQRLIEQEDKRNPLSDDQLMSHLKETGVVVARRTVAKYREALNIPSSYQRKKLCQLLTF